MLNKTQLTETGCQSYPLFPPSQPCQRLSDDQAIIQIPEYMLFSQRAELFRRLHSGSSTDASGMSKYLGEIKHTCGNGWACFYVDSNQTAENDFVKNEQAQAAGQQLDASSA